MKITFYSDRFLQQIAQMNTNKINL